MARDVHACRTSSGANELLSKSPPVGRPAGRPAAAVRPAPRGRMQIADWIQPATTTNSDVRSSAAAALTTERHSVKRKRKAKEH